MIGRLTLRVVVSTGCTTCWRARELAEVVGQLRPSQPVEVIDLDGPSVPVPEGVVGTPTILLGPQIVTLGNPTLEALLATLDGAALATGPC